MIVKRLLLCAGCIVACSSTVAGQGAKLPAAAVKAIDAANWDEAIRRLQAKGPHNGTEAANYWLGLAYYSKGNAAKAVSHLLNAHRADPTNTTTLRLLARAAVAANPRPWKIPGIVQDLVKAGSHDGDVMHHVGRIYLNRYYFQVNASHPMFQRGMQAALSSAVRHFKEADRLGTSEPFNDLWLATLHYRGGKHEDALRYARQATRRGPVGWEVPVMIGGSLAALGRHTEAEQAYAEAKRLAPGKAAAVEYQRGKTLLEVGRYNEALNAFRYVLKNAWALENVRHRIGRAALGARNYRVAAWAFEDSRTVDGRLEDRYYLGRCAYGSGHYAAAEKLFQQAIDEYNAKVKSSAYKWQKPPSDWIHYRGRAKWALGKKDEAIKDLEAAFGRKTSNMMYARWLYRAHVARVDLHAAIGVCDRLGRTSRKDAAIEGIQSILKKWPTPRMQDFFAKKKPHTFYGWDMLGNVYYRKGHYFTAAHYYGKARRLRGLPAKVWAGWSLVYSRRLDQAERCFRDCIKVRKPKDKDYGRFGLSCVLMAKGKWAEADQVMAEIKKELMLPCRDTGRLWAAVAMKKKPNAPVDPYTLLGMMYARACGASSGEEIMFIIPDSPLDRATPKLRQDDVIIRVGESSLGTSKDRAAFRKTKIPDKPAKTLVRRGKYRFYVTIDYPAALRQVSAAPKPPANTEGGR